MIGGPARQAPTEHDGSRPQELARSGHRALQINTTSVSTSVLPDVPRDSWIRCVTPVPRYWVSSFASVDGTPRLRQRAARRRTRTRQRVTGERGAAAPADSAGERAPPWPPAG